jgi:hypothetical protein
MYHVRKPDSKPWLHLRLELPAVDYGGIDVASIPLPSVSWLNKKSCEFALDLWKPRGYRRTAIQAGTAHRD